MSKYEELKYVLSGATDWGYEYAKKEDVEAAFAELEERHSMELDQWVLELGKKKLENERLKKSLFNVQKAASDAKLSAHEKSRRIDELKAEADKVIADLEKSHKIEVEKLLMKIAGLEKLVETADKLLKPKGGFTIKDIKFGGVKLEGINSIKRRPTNEP